MNVGPKREIPLQAEWSIRPQERTAKCPRLTARRKSPIRA
jgi:hypothetical protein